MLILVWTMSLKVISCCTNRRGTYDFLLALNSSLTFIFNRSWDVTPSLHIHTHLSSRWNWKRWLLWCQGAQNIRLSNHKLKYAPKCTVWSQCTPVPEGPTDRWTNIMAKVRQFVLTNVLHVEKLSQQS